MPVGVGDSDFNRPVARHREFRGEFLFLAHAGVGIDPHCAQTPVGPSSPSLGNGVVPSGSRARNVSSGCSRKASRPVCWVLLAACWPIGGEGFPRASAHYSGGSSRMGGAKFVRRGGRGCADFLVAGPPVFLGVGGGRATAWTYSEAGRAVSAPPRPLGHIPRLGPGRRREIIVQCFRDVVPFEAGHRAAEFIAGRRGG